MESGGVGSHNRSTGVVSATPSPTPVTEAMPTRGPTFFFDFVDPASYLVTHMIDRAGATAAFDWRGFELRVPPAPLVDPAAGDWLAYQSRAGAYADGLALRMAVPEFVPWTRKAHELSEFARERDCDEAVRRALFQAHYVDRTDIGRIDLLVEVAHGAGLDRSEAKAVLDVDRYASVVHGNRDMARAHGIGGVPALAAGDRRLEGLRPPDEVERWIEQWI